MAAGVAVRSQYAASSGRERWGGGDRDWGGAGERGAVGLGRGLAGLAGPAAELTAGLVAEVADRLTAQLSGVRWKVEFVIDRLVEPPTDLTEVISAGQRSCWTAAGTWWCA